MNADPWSVTYQIVAGKLKTGSALSTVRKPDGHLTKGWAETANTLLNGQFLKAELQQEYQPPRHCPELPEQTVDTSEVIEHIKSLKNNKAAGGIELKTKC